MSLAFDISGSFKHSLYDGGDFSPIPFQSSGNYTTRDGGLFTLTGSGTQVVDFGTVAKAKALLILVGTGAGAAEIGVKLNGQTTATPITPGGGMVLWSPTPDTGISSISIDYTSDIVVQVVALG